MDIAKIVNSQITNLEKLKKILFYLVTGILLSSLLLLYLYNNSNYGLFPLILFTVLIIVIVSAISLTLEYFHIVREIRYNELLLQSLMEDKTYV
ncbi:hypothetical protein [Ferroplasma acidarmanus]|uniref:Uncharacterized protein n=1 Tax=Ferroplasma acidarmanus Fer1 TaxID=333146 RepID=S0AR34_FERAC|nr:hypothetical protein [Ferroplasma acidarmanus]AGO60555.1 hypothetical protein FACI_IFERC00001G0575 [Ferroplasma acidarmanus Fer1]